MGITYQKHIRALHTSIQLSYFHPLRRDALSILKLCMAVCDIHVFVETMELYPTVTLYEQDAI